MAKKKGGEGAAKENEPVKSVNVFKCGHPDCEALKDMEMAEFKEHALSVHGIANDQFKGTRKMVMHMDGDKWFSSTYEWVLESGLKFHQFVELPRGKSNFY